MLLNKPIFPGSSTVNQFEKIIEVLGVPSKEELESLNAPLVYSLISNLKIQKFKNLSRTLNNIDPVFVDFVK